MGMSSSQARLLNLTARMHQIEYKAARLEAQKLQMANESRRVYEDYLNALDSTKIQHKSLNTDGSVTYKDVSYYDLCLGTSGEQYGLFSVENGFMYVPQAIKTAYETSTSAEDFASKLAHYTPPVIPESTTVTPSVPTTEPVPSGNNITLNMGESNSTTITSPITLTLNNTFNGGNYTYTISSSNQNATFTYLENGRLVIQGNNLNITASGSQADDIILLGNNNVIDTGDGNDKIRIGGARDSSYSSYTSASYFNNVKSGSGDDYIQVFSGSNNTINGEGGNDTLLSFGVNSVSNVEKDINNYDSTDGNLDWIMQQYYGDCQFLSLVNSINNKGQFQNYFDIVDNGSGSSWTVTFKKSGEVVTVYPSDITSASSIGDKDISVLEAGFRKIIESEGYNINGSSDSMSTGSSVNFHIVAKHVLGIDECVTVEFNQALFNDLWNKYNSGAISNLVIGTKQNSSEAAYELGIMEQHAYSVTNVTSNTVTVVNPHDNKDSITLKKSDFYNLFGSIILYGDSYNYVSEHYTINGGIASISEHNDNVIQIQNDNYIFGEDISPAEKYNYFINIYNAIKTAGGCEIIPDDMVQNKNWLVNVINGGFGYLKMVNKNEWVDTSISTNTSLQEVSNEVMLKKAEAKYESDMKRIDMKDRKYDTDLAALDTERNAIKQEMETLKTVAKDNVDRTFKLFS